MKDYMFKMKMKTRDYELDAQGVVNNANYQHYLEVTRHEWLELQGHSFQKWHEKGIDVMVAEINMKYKMPLRGQEVFISCLNLKREGPRFIFEQDLYRAEDQALVMKAKVTIVSVINGVLSRGDEIAEMLSC